MVDVLQLISVSFERCLFCHHAVCVGIENFLRLELYRNRSAQNMQALYEILIFAEHSLSEQYAMFKCFNCIPIVSQ